MPPQKSPEAFRTISEVADWLGVNPHVLRFWESKFAQIKPIKRAGGRRYYRVADMELLGGLKQLLHEDGLTIKGAQKVLREQGVKAVQALSPPVDGPAAPATSPTGAPEADARPPGSAGEAEAPATEEPARPADRHAAPGAGGDAGDDAVDDAGEEREPADPAMPEIAPLPGTGDAAQPGLFADLPPLPAAPAADPPDAAAAPAGPAETDAQPPKAPASDAAAPEPAGPAPEIAPLPGPRPPLTVALARLRPGQAPAAEIAPLLARARSLRARMQMPVTARDGGAGAGADGRAGDGGQRG